MQAVQRSRAVARVRRFLVVAAGSCVLIAVALITLPNRPSVGFTLLSLEARINGTNVTATTVVAATEQTQANRYGVCVRDQRGAAADFAPLSDVELSAEGSRFSSTKRFAAGTYNYYACVKAGGRTYIVGGAKRFSLGQGSPAADRGGLSSSPSTTARGPAPTSAPAATGSKFVAGGRPRASSSGPTTAEPAATGSKPGAASGPSGGNAPVGTQPANPRPIPATSSADPSGVPMPVVNLAGWRQIVAQDFTAATPLGSFPGGAYSSGFFPYAGYRDTSGKGTYDPAKVMSVKGGALDWYLHSQSGQSYVSAIVPRVPATRWGQIYGRYSIRFRSDVLPGYKLAFMLWPDSDNWSDGEVDFPEVNELTANSFIYANRYAADRSDLTGGTTGFKTSTSAAGSGWHTATIEWGPGRLTYILDGVTLGTTSTNVPYKSMHWVLQVETALSGPAPESSVAGHVQVDWVTMYSRS
jgi:hypothetical protein